MPDAVHVDTLERLIALEHEVFYTEPPREGEQPFAYEPGRLPILLSAPHGAEHLRNGRYKEEDEYTASIARLVGENTGAHVLYSYAQSDSDPNWDRHAPYKERLSEIVDEANIGFVLDIHGMSNRHKFGLALGTIRGRSCPNHEALIVKTLEANQFRPATIGEARTFESLQWDRFVVNPPRFTGGVSNHTVTRYVSQELRVAGAQLELCSNMRVVERRSPSKRPQRFSGDPAAIVHTIQTLEHLVHTLVDAGPGHS